MYACVVVHGCFGDYVLCKTSRSGCSCWKKEAKKRLQILDASPSSLVDDDDDDDDDADVDVEVDENVDAANAELDVAGQSTVVGADVAEVEADVDEENTLTVVEVDDVAGVDDSVVDLLQTNSKLTTGRSFSRLSFTLFGSSCWSSGKRRSAMVIMPLLANAFKLFLGYVFF